MTIATEIPWIEAGAGALVLAPMEGVTDRPMRALLSELGGFTFCVAEFLRISQAVPGLRVFQRHVPELMNGGRTPAGLPVQVQILGGDPALLAEAALVAVRAGARAVDLNFGCPARTVNRHDGGATLLQYPERIRAIVAAVRAAVPAHVPVSAKLRLGWDDMQAIHVNAERAAEGGFDWITVHAHQDAGLSATCLLEAARRGTPRLGIPVVANGEIWTIDDRAAAGTRPAVSTSCWAAGRWPILALEAPASLALAAVRIGLTGTPAEWLALLLRYADLCRVSGLPSKYILPRVKQWLRMANHDGRLSWFDAVKGCAELEDLLNYLGAARRSDAGRARLLPSRVLAGT
ncbi:MAG: tRNA-dihydrouridine synthase [Gemmataceae bacterium]